ncbi:MAG: type IV pilus modification protein PilV [Lysobacterales bacterium]|jgi:type IV pilus modification protein PilV
MQRKRQPRNRGFTLMEILIALLIISIGLAALANLQGKLTRYSAVAKQRTLAMNLAEQQIETMQSFYTMGDTGADACSTAQTGFDDLTNCTAGSTVNVGDMQFTLTWSVENYTQGADGTTSPYVASGTHSRPDLKKVAITVSWTDGQGAAQHAELTDVIDDTSIFNTGRVLARVDSNTPPKVPYVASDFPGVVEIALGSEKIKGSTTPEPEIVNQGNNVITSFDVVTFLQSNSSAYLQRREEFKVLNCLCSMDAGTGTGREPTVWNGTDYTLGDEVSKRTGSVSGNESGQPPLCGECCRDHHDADGAAVKYDPWRPAFSGDAGGFDFHGDHAHYHIVNGVKELAAEGDDYMEACRFVRKDGIFRLTTDMALQNLDNVPAAYPGNYNSDYSTSVVDFVAAFSGAIDPDTYPGVVPDATYSSGAGGIFLANLGVIKSAMARGIYVDYIGSDLLKKILCLQAGGEGAYADYCDTSEDPTWLEILPFYDVDTTSLANWTRASSAINVTNSPISDIDKSSFSRGGVSIAQDHFDVETDVTASIEHSNTGLTDTNPIDPDDELEDSADIPVKVVIGGTPPASGILVQGNINAGTSQINVETVRVRQYAPNIDCEIITITSGHTAQKAYTCDLETYAGLATGTVTISDYNALKVTGNSSTVLNRQVCYSGVDVSSVQVVDDGVLANPDQDITGEVTVLGVTNLAANTTIDITIVNQGDTCP